MKNPLSGVKTFVFEKFSFDEAKKKLRLHYSFDGRIYLTESFTFEFDFAPNYSKEALEKAFFGLWIMAGISYFKTCLAQKIKIKKHKLTKDQAYFFTKIYENGLGEFFVENTLDPHNQIHFNYDEKTDSHAISLDLDGTIVPIGGGKDSCVTAQILQNNKEEFSTWHIGSSDVIKDCVDVIGTENLKISREISPGLFLLNEQGALNGHIPISAILAFSSVVTAILTGKKNIAFSNENSANIGNIEYQGKMMNHQYSKSLEFEQDFQTYVSANISPDIKYFSFLRPLTELKIAELFATECWQDFSTVFASCNRNFHIRESADQKWCLKCSKCAFVGMILAPFVSKVEFREIFGDFFANPDLQNHFAELLGISGHKPFECVGEIEEAQLAIRLAFEKYPELQTFIEKLPQSVFDKDKFHEDAMPEKFLGILKKDAKSI